MTETPKATTAEDTNVQDYILPNKVYDVLKLLAVIIIPALATFYVTIAAIWGLAAGPEVSGTAVAFATFLGVIVKLGDKSYNASDGKFDGVINVDQTDGTKTVSLEVPGDPNDIVKQDQVTLKVNAPS